MSRTLEYIFPIADTEDVCLEQDVAAAGYLVLDGNLANQINSEVSFLSKGYSRSISITSDQDLSGVIFTIKGVQNNTIIIENIFGPNGDTGYGTLIYDSITSIYVDDAVENVSVGTGYLGFFPLININLEKPLNYSLSTSTLTTNPIPTVIYSVYIDIVNNGQSFLENIASNINSFFILKAQSADEQHTIPLQVPFRSLLVQINGDETTLADSLSLTFIQI